MKRFKKILIDLSGTKDPTNILKMATDLALNNQATLGLIQTLKPFPSYATMLASDFHLEELISSVTQTRTEHLKTLMAPVQEQGIDCSIKIRWGTPFFETIQEVLEGEYDLLIKTAEDEQNFSSTLFGSTDLHLLRKCPCPIWLLKPDLKSTFSHILAAIDIEQQTLEEKNLNRKILELSTSLSILHSSVVEVVYCWKPFGIQHLKKRCSEEEIETFKNQSFSKVEQLFKSTIDPMMDDYPNLKSQIIEGSPEVQLAKHIVQNKIDLVVMGSLGRTGIPGLLIGNTAERLFSELPCSVLTTKPMGFESPVVLNS